MSSAVARLFDAMADRYDELEPWYEHLYDVLHAIVREVIGRPPVAGARALDAGCGTGFQSTLLADLGWRPYGIDVSPALLDVARRRLPTGRLTLASVEALPYPAAHFDVAAACGSTLSFVDDPARALVELGRVLRPGGRLLLDCEHRPSLDLLWALGSALTGDSLGYGVTPREAWRALHPRDGVRVPYPGYGALWLFGDRELRRMLSAAGLVPLRAWGVHAITNLLPSTVLHRARLPRALAAAYRGLRRLDTALAPTAAGRALANSLVILAERAQPSA
jgi:SAM-dependent methyltransferase